MADPAVDSAAATATAWTVAGHGVERPVEQAVATASMAGHYQRTHDLSVHCSVTTPCDELHNIAA